MMLRLFLPVLFLASLCAHADDTFVYAVEISATVQTSPPKIRLKWEPDPYGAISYTVSRKGRNATAWGPGVVLPGTATGFNDPNVAVGGNYEYQVVKAGQGYTGYGYIYAGINAPLRDLRGKIILVVADTYAAELAPELARLKSDLMGDGWQVIRHDVSPTATAGSVRNLIIADYNADRANVHAVLLFGHVPIKHSGTLEYDGHGARPMPADTFYADVNGNWGTNPSYLPSDAELMVGRVDFFNMPGLTASTPWPSEVEMLRNYLNKDHAWRHKLFTVPRQALMGNRVGDEGGMASAATGYRNFAPLVGPGTIVEANVQDNAPSSERWIALITTGQFLWAYGCGGGGGDSMSQLGTHGLYNDVWSSDIIGQDAQAVFSMCYGSHLGEWDVTDNIMRAMLATSIGLTCCMGGKPHWYLHHMGLGEPIGYSAKVTMNNNTLYKSQVNQYRRGVHIGLLGDPTLRLDMVSPPANLVAARQGSNVVLTWSPSGEAVAGYHVYRAARPAGPYVRITSALLTGTKFTDVRRTTGATYIVRAVKLQVTPSGTYWNPSQGVFASVGGL
ncbi:MAG TPA: hypothetical protein VJ063_21405 [Verrucomicrobiae bacterium]|nr:hypothetical protein [Verrucomicrobiae bacterium]